MPSIYIKDIENLKTNYKNYTNFIETGTYFGNTISNMEPYFSKLYTIEIQKPLYNYNVQRYNGNKINFYLGDSMDILPIILPKINGKSIFFLDGHWSSDNITGRGKKDCPLYEELSSIMKLHEDEAIIIIDDVRLFGFGSHLNKNVCNWVDINLQNILKTVKNRMTKHYYFPSVLDPQDRLVIHLKKLN